MDCAKRLRLKIQQPYFFRDNANDYQVRRRAWFTVQSRRKPLNLCINAMVRVSCNPVFRTEDPPASPLPKSFSHEQIRVTWLKVSCLVFGNTATSFYFADLPKIVVGWATVAGGKNPSSFFCRALPIYGANLFSRINHQPMEYILTIPSKPSYPNSGRRGQADKTVAKSTATSYMTSVPVSLLVASPKTLRLNFSVTLLDFTNRQLTPLSPVSLLPSLPCTKLFRTPF